MVTKTRQQKNSNVLRTLVLALKKSCRKNFLKIGLKFKATFRRALDKNIQIRFVVVVKTFIVTRLMPPFEK